MFSVQDCTDNMHLDFAIYNRQAFRNEVLGLTGRYTVKLNFSMTSCFTTQNLFLAKQNEEKKKVCFPQENKRKRREE